MNTEKNKEKWLKMIKINLELGGRSDYTVRNYIYAIKHFLNSYSEKKDISKFREKEIIKYFNNYYLNNNTKATTYNFNLAVIKYFYSVCFNAILSNRLLPKARIPKKLPVILSKSEFINLVNGERNIEHKCFLLLGFCCGLRASEAVSIRIENIDSKNHKLKIVGKGNKERYTILPDIVIYYLRLYYKLKNKRRLLVQRSTRQ